MADAELTLHEAAELLGVHYMTAYRYVRLGLLPAVKSGGTWRVAQADLDEYQVALAAPPASGGRRKAPWAERLEARLIAGDARGSWGVIEAALAAGTELDEIYLDMLAPAMRSIGTRWSDGELDISVEHRASGIAMRLIGRLGPRFVRRGRTRGTVILGAPAGERHSLPVALLADLVRIGGWEVSDLGADVPDPSFVHAALTTPDLFAIGVSVTNTDCLDSARSVLGALRDALPHVPLVVGGAAVGDEAEALGLGAHAYARSGREFVEVLDARRSSGDGSGIDDPGIDEMDVAASR